MPSIDFKSLIPYAGSEEGARPLFQRLITSLLRIKYRDAREIRPNPGDWGIDVLVGELSGHCLVWQVKYFINGVGKSQQQNINESFEMLMRKAKEEKFSVDAWTLCIPCSLAAKESKWWEKWKKDKMSKYDIEIKLMDETDIRTELEFPEAEHLRLGYFSSNPTIAYYFLESMKGKTEREIQELPEPSLFSDALFIKKLKAAGISEFISAKTQFFNAELLTQEIIDKGDFSEIKSLKGLKEKLRSMWETRFSKSFTLPDDQMGILYSAVMESIEEHDKKSLDHPDLMATFVHKQGIIHQLSNNCQVGWTKDFREKFGNSHEES